MSQLIAAILAYLTGPRVQMIALAVAGPVLTAMVCWLIWLVRNGWPSSLASQQLTILGWALAGAMALLGIVVIAMTAGLIKGVKLSGPVGLSAEINTDDD